MVIQRETNEKSHTNIQIDSRRDRKMFHQAALLCPTPLFAGDPCPAGPSAFRFPLASLADFVKRPFAAPVRGSSFIDLNPVWYTRDPVGRLSSIPKVQLIRAR